MKEKIFINARIIDPSQNIDEKGSLILNDKGKVKAIGKNVKKTDASKDAEVIDLKGNILIPGLVDMKAFVGEPGYEYKENFRTLSQAAYIFIIGGALGNIIDRAGDGVVTDFLHLYINNFSFFIFNPADAFISLGAILLITSELKMQKSNG